MLVSSNFRVNLVALEVSVKPFEIESERLRKLIEQFLSTSLTNVSDAQYITVTPRSVIDSTGTVADVNGLINDVAAKQAQTRTALPSSP